MTISDPRVRALLRRADKVARSGKRAAAAQLYREIVEDAPELEDAWLGLANVTFDEEEKTQALQTVLELDPENEAAQLELAILRGEAEPETAVAPPPSPPPVEPEPAPETAVAPPAQDHNHIEIDTWADEKLFCYRHPDRETSLRCYNCDNPICSQCAIKTPVGYSCPVCIRQKEDVFYNARPADYLIAPLAALPLSLLAGFLVLRFSGGFFIILIMFFVGGLIGGFIGRIAKRTVGNRRGRYLPHLVAGVVVLGVLLPALPVLVAIIFGNPGALFVLLGPGIYLFTATGAAYYQMK